MANSFSNVVDTIFAKGLMALRQSAIMPRLVNTDWSAEIAQVGDTINVPIPSGMTVDDVTPGPTPPAGGNTAPQRVPIALNKHRQTSMHLTDKEAREIVDGVYSIQLSEAMKALANDVDSYIFSLYTGIYGWSGAAGTTPFASDLTVATTARRILGEQLAPMDPRRIVLGTAAEANALNLSVVQQAQNRANTENTLRTGLIGTMLGFDWYLDQLIPTHTATAFTAGAATINGAHAVGAGTTDGGRTGVISIAKATNAGVVTKGDIIEIAGDTQTYTVMADATLIVGNTAVTISPALMKAAAGGEAVTKKASHVVNLAFHRDAFALAVRPLGAADGFTGGHEIRTGVDPISGLAITLEVSREYMRTKWQWSILYGASLVRPELACRIAG